MAQNGIVLVVSVSLFKDGEVLMIKENKPSAMNKWNFPSGRIESGEDILYAARREVKEETGFYVELTTTTGIYNFISSAGNQVVLFHFTGEVTGGSLDIKEDEIIDFKWVNMSDLVNFDNEELRDAGVIKQIGNSLVNKSFYSVNIFNQQLGK
ncbi:MULTISPECIES: NUDIX hydrolase [unclassified Bacillus (in: firmicutes)]|uniref:NUDIX hydrolase n=1 Tax=unclassified Bacillus (in: firmicutes) TaxID=185979 RepID=UPI001BE81927|nr:MULTISPECIES: NUDIX domain-containing protein [unclassified Bacillus (in: firmicutes)]MBT2614901.1 NUDIX domain-containing protein [Bacillus sp. ISL-78]MBT2631801.1 NUDIX domain-containing protein [Bacillus sp. ISL-101]